MKKIGFVGLGIMGKPMAKNLIKAGYSLVVFDIVKEQVAELVGLGAEEAVSPKEVAQKTETIITMLPNSPHVKQVVCGENGLIEGAKAGSIIIDMSSIAPLASKELHRACAEKGVKFMDAPVSGGEPKAIDGTLSIMVGGDEADFNRNFELFKAMGSGITRTGEIGSGNITKLANQIIVALNIAAMSEALVLGTKAGVDPEIIFNAVKGGLAGSTVLNAKAPMVLSRNFNPGFKIDLHIKDLANVLETSREIGVPLPLTSMVMEIMQSLKVEGKGGCDHSSIVQFYEKLANIEVKPQKFLKTE